MASDMAKGALKLTFGRGVHASVRAKDVNVAECVRGENFDLDIDFAGFRGRKAFDLVATTPNGARINGLGQLVKANGDISTWVQSGGTVYSWDGSSTFAVIGSVSDSARLRGPRQHIWNLTDKLIVTDLAKVEPLKEWDGTTFQNVSHSLGSTLYAKYALVENERLLLGNVTTGSTATPHVLLASAMEDYTILDNATRPLVAAALGSAWYLPLPDFKPINGLFEGIGSIGLSTEGGRIYRLKGTNKFDYELEPFYLGSSASGDEAVVNIGNDVLIGRAGHIDALSGTINYGDVEADDVEKWIQPLVEDVTSWTMTYDQRLQKVFCVPDGGNLIWVLYKNVLASGDGLSPWSKWTTVHSSSFQPTTMMALKRPSDGIDVVYFGDTAGNIYQMDGSGGQDGGSSDITAFRESGLLVPPTKDQGAAPGVFDGDGYVDYRRLAASSLTLKFQHAGVSIFDQSVTIALPASETFSVFGGSAYFGGSFYYGDAFSNRIARQTFNVAGQSSGFQLRAEISGANEFELDEIGLGFDTAD